MNGHWTAAIGFVAAGAVFAVAAMAVFFAWVLRRAGFGRSGG